MKELSLHAARAIHLAAQGLTGSRAEPAGKADVLEMIRRMGLLQIDTISVVARSPYLVLWSRLGEYEPAWLDELLAEGALFEYWSHAACFLPIEQYRIYRRSMLEHAEEYDVTLPKWMETNARPRVLQQIRERGATRSAHFERTDGKAGGWWSWKPEKIALELLFNAGALMIARREGFQRVYDLRERVLPEWNDCDALSHDEGARALVLHAVKALGVATVPWTLRYFMNYLWHEVHYRKRPGANKQVAALLEELTREGTLSRVEVAGWKTPAYVHSDTLPVAAEAAAGALPPCRTTFLSPFDPVVSNRERAKQLFGFEYRIETYTPEANRQFGYYSLPILHRNELIGRLDAKAHRKQGQFEVKAIHLEPETLMTDALVESLAATLTECAAWHKTPDVVVRRSNPTEFADRLTSALR